MKLTGFELEIEGSREDVPMIAQNLGQQLSSIMNPSSAVIEGKFLNGNSTFDADEPPVSTIDDSGKPAKKRRKPSKVATEKQNGSAVMEWRHDSSKYGEPAQTWKLTEKAIWLIHVIKSELQRDQLSASEIAETFNKKFKHSGTIRASNVSKYLGELKSKSGTPAQVGLDTQKSPNEWYLTTEGTKAAQALIKSLLQQ